MSQHRFTNITAAVLLLFFCGCGKKSDTPTESSQTSATPQAAQQPAAPAQQPVEQPSPPTPPPPPPPVVIPAGTVLTVSLQQPVGSKTSQEGDRFEATLANSIVVGGDVAAPKGSRAYGTVTEAHAAGKFKEGAAIGAAVGAGAGTAGAAFTGNNRDISLPVETPLKFKLTESITVKQTAAESASTEIAPAAEGSANR